MGEQDDPINKRDVVDDKMALSDRFGLSLGFHNLDQDAYVAIVAGYAGHYGLEFDPHEAVQWSTIRGSRSGRVAWQYVVDLAGRKGIRRSEEHTSELQSLMRISYAVFCLKKKNTTMNEKMKS